jgi:hypothetical protein
LALQPKLRPDLSRMTPEEFERYAALNGHCSALVKVRTQDREKRVCESVCQLMARQLTGNYSDLFAGHSSWFTYGAMNRYCACSSILVCVIACIDSCLSLTQTNNTTASLIFAIPLLTTVSLSLRHSSRIYKHFTFNLNAPSTAARSTSFSSYPGFLSSLDDFYIVSVPLSLSLSLFFFLSILRTG